MIHRGEAKIKKLFDTTLTKIEANEIKKHVNEYNTLQKVSEKVRHQEKAP